MPRVSAASRSVFATMTAIERGVRPDPPAKLNPLEAEVWKITVDSMPPEWFPPETHVLLQRYCVHVAGLAFIDKTIKSIENAPEGDLDRWLELTDARRKEDHAITMLATKMRLSQQSSYNKMQADTSKRTKRAASIVPVRESREPVPPADPWS